MKNHGLLLIKNSRFSKFQNLDFEKLNGFSFKPRNNVAYGGILVSKCVMFNPSYTETILKKKIKNRLELYLRFIISILENDDDDTDITDLRAALNDLTRYKSIVRNKYLLYLDKRYAEILLKKIELLEQELKRKIINFVPKEEEYVEEHRRSR